MFLQCNYKKSLKFSLMDLAHNLLLCQTGFSDYINYLVEPLDLDVTDH